MRRRFQFDLKTVLVATLVIAWIADIVSYPVRPLDCPSCVNGVPNALFYGTAAAGNSSLGCCRCQARGFLPRVQLMPSPLFSIRNFLWLTLLTGALLGRILFDRERMRRVEAAYSSVGLLSRPEFQGQAAAIRKGFGELTD